MPTKVIIDCPSCGKVAQWNHIMPNEIPAEIPCVICGSDASVREKGLTMSAEQPIILEAKSYTPAYTESTKKRKK